MTTAGTLASSLLVAGLLVPLLAAVRRLNIRGALALTLELWTAGALVHLCFDRAWRAILVAGALVLTRGLLRLWAGRRRCAPEHRW